MDGGRERSEVFAPGLLSGRVALVTGGGTGLGKASALELVRCGASVTIAGRRGEVLEQAVAEISELAGPGAGGGTSTSTSTSTGTGAERTRVRGRRGIGVARPTGWRATCASAEQARELVRTVLERHGGWTCSSTTPAASSSARPS